MISDNLRERYLLSQHFALPTFFLDCKYDEFDEEEKIAFTCSFENTLASARIKKPYNPQDAIAARPQNVKLEEEKKQLEEEKFFLQRLLGKTRKKPRKRQF